MKPVIKLGALIIVFLSLLLTACTKPSDPDLLSTEFTSFQLTTEDNPGLPVSISGSLDGDTVTLQYPNTMIPGFHWIPRFDTNAVSVEIDGVPQYSGTGPVDFSTPVIYTLTSSTGQIRTMTVQLVLNPGWIDLGTNPVVAAGTGIYNIRTGMMLGINPYVACMDSAGVLKAYILGISDGVWREYSNTPPSNLVHFDALSWKSQIWALYESSAGLVTSQFTTTTAGPWSAPLPLTATAGTQDLQLFKGSEDRIFASWIEDPAGSASPFVWTTDSTGAWKQIVGPLSSLHADTMAAASAGGTVVYAVCTFTENPGTLHLFMYDFTSDQWNMTVGGGSLFQEDDQRVIRLFYDEVKKSPVVFTILPSSNDPGFYILRALYWNDTAGLWTNLDYIQPLTVSSGSVVSLSLSWYDNTPTVAAGSSVLTWDGRRWLSVETPYTAAVPVFQSLTSGPLNTYFAAFTSDPAAGDLTARIRQ